MRNNRLNQKKLRTRRSNVSSRGYRPTPSLFKSGPIVKRWIDYYTTIETSSQGSPVFKPYNETFIELPVVLERLAEASQFKDNAKNWRIKDLYLEFTPLTDDPTLPPILVGIDIDPSYLATNPTLKLKTGKALRVIRRRHRLTKRDLSNAKDLVFHDGPLMSSDLYLTIAWQPGITTTEEAKPIYAVHLGFGVQFQLADKVSYSSNILVSLDKMRVADHATATKEKEVIDEGVQCDYEDIKKHLIIQKRQMREKLRKEKKERLEKEKKEKEKRNFEEKRKKYKVIMKGRIKAHIDEEHLPALFEDIRQPPADLLIEQFKNESEQAEKIAKKMMKKEQVIEAGITENAIFNRLFNFWYYLDTEITKDTAMTLLKTEEKLIKQGKIKKYKEDFEEDDDEEDEESEDDIIVEDD